jgi:hypothetical protein
MLFSDLICIIAAILVSAGMGLTATVAGAVVGIPLAAFAHGVSLLTSFNAFMFSTGYYLYHRVPLMEGRKLATWGVSAIMKVFPYSNLFPTLTFSFVLITFMENAKRGSGIIGKVAQTAVAKTGPAGAIAGKVLSKV